MHTCLIQILRAGFLSAMYGCVKITKNGPFTQMIHVIQCNIAVITTFLFSVGKYLHRLFMVYWGIVN